MTEDQAASPSEETLQAVLEALNDRDLDTAMSYFVEDCVFETPRGRRPWGRRLHGIDAVRGAFDAQFGRIPDARYIEDEHRVCGSHGTSEWTFVGTKPNGDEIELRGCDLWEFRDGKIARRSTFWKFVGEQRPQLAEPREPGGPIYS